MEDRKKVRSFYSKLLKYSLIKGAVELGANSTVVRTTMENSLSNMRKKGWNIHLNMRDKRKTYNPVCYIESGIDFRPKGGVSLVVTIKDINSSIGVYVSDLFQLLQEFQEATNEVPRNGEDIEYLDKSE